MYLAVDVQYKGPDSATAAGVLFSAWESEAAVDVLTVRLDAVEPYEPGAFYKRELPCILALLAKIDRRLDAIIIDGFVTLGSDRRPGLGMHLYRALDEQVPIIGVAKNAFPDTPTETRVYRGDSRRPLFVTSAGIEMERARSIVQSMHGTGRIPTLLKLADQACRRSQSQRPAT